MDITRFGFAIVASGLDFSDIATVIPARVKGELIVADRLNVNSGDNAYTVEARQDQLPFVNDNVIFVYEGRVDNRQNIAALLRRPELASASDGTVLLAAYETWGTDLTQRVHGEYSYALLDRRKRTVAAGQDALGIRRIYYRQSGQHIWITSDLRYLFARFPQLRPSIDGETLTEYFSGPFTPWSGRTIWQGVRQLRRAHALELSGGQLRERRVWQLNPRAIPFKHASEVDEAFRGHLFEAVESSLRATGPILCDVSGGYDSSTIFSVAHGRQKLGVASNIIPWAFKNRTGNEACYREQLSAHFKTSIHIIDRLQFLPFQYLDAGAELPAGGFVQAGALTQEVRRLADGHGARSRLTGLAADVLFHKGGAPLYLGEWLRAGRVRDWARHLGGYLRAGSHSLWHLLNDCTIGSIDLLAGTSRRDPPDWMLASFLNKVRARQSEFLRLPRTLRSHSREFVYRHTVFQLPYHERMLPDQRFPLISIPLFEFVLGLDWKYVVEPGEARLLMRRALKGILPETVRAGGTIAHHNAAIFEGLRLAWPRVQHLLTGEQLASYGVVEPKRFRTTIERMKGGYGGPNQAFSLTALYLEAWLGTKFQSDHRNVPCTSTLDRCSGKLRSD